MTDYKYSFSSSHEPNMCKHIGWNSTSNLVPARIKTFDNKPIIGWKKAWFHKKNKGWVTNTKCLVKLEISARAHRYQPKNYKCRASSAKVLAIYEHPDHNAGELVKSRRKAYSKHDSKFVYVVGKTVKPKKRFSHQFREDCASGIHFFLEKSEAFSYT